MYLKSDESTCRYQSLLAPSSLTVKGRRKKKTHRHLCRLAGSLEKPNRALNVEQTLGTARRPDSGLDTDPVLFQVVGNQGSLPRHLAVNLLVVTAKVVGRLGESVGSAGDVDVAAIIGLEDAISVDGSSVMI